LDARSLTTANKSFGDLLSLIESTGAALAFEERHRNNDDLLRQRNALQSLIQQGRQIGRNRLNALVLEEMNQIAKRAFISSIGNRLPEWRGRPAAQAAHWTSAGLDILAEKLFPANAANDSIDRNDLLTTGFANR
jgi:hypothetical protein